MQSELNSIFNTQLDVDGWYGKQSAGTVKDLQKELSLPATGVLDVQTFYQLQLAVESGAKYKRSVTPVSTVAGIKPPTGNTVPNYAPSSVPGDYNRNGIPDQYDKYAQGNKGFGDFRVAQEAGNSTLIPNIKLEEFGDDKTFSEKLILGTLAIEGGLIADDLSVIGFGDDILIPVVAVLGGIAITGAIIYETVEQAKAGDGISEHTKRKGSKGKTNDKHTKPRPGRDSEKKKQRDDWKKRNP